MRDADGTSPERFSGDHLDGLFKPLTRYSHVALAVSGGPDSLALMMLARRWNAGRNNGPVMSVLTVDHGLRAAAGDETRMVRDLANRLGLECEILVWHGQKPDSGLQDAARRARYDLLENWCRENGAEALVLAHTCDDQSETVLMRFLRGSGVDGLSAMSQTTTQGVVDFVRPLLGIEKKDLASVLEHEGVHAANDPSNRDTRFERVRLRQALCVLESHGLQRDALARTARRMESAREALEHFTDRAIADSVRWSPLGYCEIGRAGLGANVREIGLRVVSRCLSAIGGQVYPCNWDALNLLYDTLIGAQTGRQTLHNCLLQPTADTILITRETGSRSADPMTVEPDKTIQWDNRYKICVAHGISNLATVGALEAEGWRQVKERAHDLSHLPGAVCHALPAVRLEDGRIRVPHSTCAELNEGVMVEFTDRDLLRGADQIRQ